MKQWLCPSCQKCGILVDAPDAEALEVDIRNVTVILEHPKRTWSYLCSSLNTLNQFLKHATTEQYKHQIRTLVKTMHHLMSMFIEEQKGTSIPAFDCGCKKKDGS